MERGKKHRQVSEAPPMEGQGFHWRHMVPLPWLRTPLLGPEPLGFLVQDLVGIVSMAAGYPSEGQTTLPVLSLVTGCVSFATLANLSEPLGPHLYDVEDDLIYLIGFR